MSNLVYSEVPEGKREVQSNLNQPQWIDDYGCSSRGNFFVHSIRFFYLGYNSGDYSTAYQLCKDIILADLRNDTYESVDEIMAALKTC
jgi:hypothetical protein